MKNNTTDYEKKAMTEFDKYWRRKEWRGFWSLLNPKRTDDDFKDFNRAERVFYRIKAIVCFLLNLHRNDKTTTKIYNYTNVCYWDVGTAFYEYDSYEGGEWTSLEVGNGYFKNYTIHIYNDSCI